MRSPWLLVAVLTAACGEDPVSDGKRGDGKQSALDCGDVEAWDQEWVDFEEEVLELTNDARADGHDCDTEGNFGPAPAVVFNELLRCSARLHSMDMLERGFFDHENPDGDHPSDRVEATGYDWRYVAENIAAGQTTPAEVVSDWLESDGHCSNIMSPDAVDLGVGYFFGEDDSEGYFHYWTQNFGEQF